MRLNSANNTMTGVDDGGDANATTDIKSPNDDDASADPELKCDECDFVAEDEDSLLAHRTIHDIIDAEDKAKYVKDSLVESEDIGYSNDSFHSNEEQVVSKMNGIMSLPMIGDANIQAPRPDLQCTLCEYVAFTDANLSSHMKTHQTRKSYTCDVCGMRFSQAANMRRHRMRHTGFKPYECKVCGKRFFRKDHLAEHLGTHSKTNSMYKCPICEKTFQRQYHLKLHRAEHLGDKCHICGFVAQGIKHLRIHFTRVHKKNLDNMLTGQSSSELDISTSPEGINQNVENAQDSNEAGASPPNVKSGLPGDITPRKFISLLTNNIITNRASSPSERPAHQGGGRSSGDSSSPPSKPTFPEMMESMGSSGVDVLSSIYTDAVSRTRSLLTQSYAEQMGAFAVGNYSRPYESPSLRSLLRTGRTSLESLTGRPNVDAVTARASLDSLTQSNVSPPSETPVVQPVNGNNSDENVVIKQEPMDESEQISANNNNNNPADNVETPSLETDTSATTQQGSPDSADKSSTSPLSQQSPPTHPPSENKRKGIPQQYIRNAVGNDSNDESSGERASSRNGLGSSDMADHFTSIRSALISRGASLKTARTPMVSLLKQKQRNGPSFLNSVNPDGKTSSMLLSAALTTSSTPPSYQQSLAASASSGSNPITQGDMFRSANAPSISDSSLSCPFCGIVYFDQTLYFLHKALHSDSNPWKCNVCGEQCQDKYDFNSHILSIAHN